MASVPRKKNFFKPNVAILGGMTEPDQPSFVPLPLVIRLVRRLSVETSVPRDLWIEDIRTKVFTRWLGITIRWQGPIDLLDLLVFFNYYCLTSLKDLDMASDTSVLIKKNFYNILKMECLPMSFSLSFVISTEDGIVKNFFNFKKNQEFKL